MLEMLVGMMILMDRQRARNSRGLQGPEILLKYISGIILASIKFIVCKLWIYEQHPIERFHIYPL